jgi:PhnB protein
MPQRRSTFTSGLLTRKKSDVCPAQTESLSTPHCDDFPEMSGGKSTTPTSLGGTPVTIHLTVADVDAKFQRALDAGGTVVVPLEDQFWGDRYGVLADPFGHHWSLGQPVREVSADEIAAFTGQQPG